MPNAVYQRTQPLSNMQASDIANVAKELAEFRAVIEQLKADMQDFKKTITDGNAASDAFCTQSDKRTSRLEKKVNEINKILGI